MVSASTTYWKRIQKTMKMTAQVPTRAGVITGCFFVDFPHTRGIMDPVNIIFFGEKRAPERALF